MGGTVLADISATSGGSSIAGSEITTADIAGLGPAAFRFYGPTDGTDTLWLRCPADPTLGVQEIEADEDERLDALEAGGGAHPNLATHDALGLATDAELTTHGADTTAIHGITDTAQLETLNTTQTVTAQKTYTGDNLFGSGRPWVDVRAYGTNTAAIDSAWAAAQAAGAVLYFSRGTDYAYSGSGLDATSNRIAVVGAGRDLVTITLGSGVYLFKPTGHLYQTHIEGLTTSGGKGLFQHTFTSADTDARAHVFTRCRFTGYTECAISAESSDMPYWRIIDNQFDGADDENTIGIALPTDPSGSVIRDNTFWNNRIGIKCRQAGLSVYIQNNDFVHFAGSPSQVRARVWFVPNTVSSNAGAGAVVRENKFGNENLASTDVTILYADEGAGATNSVKMPTLGSDSAGYVVGHQYEGNKVTGAGGSSIPFVYSTTPNVWGSRFGPTMFDGTAPSYVLQFRTVPGPDRNVATNVLGPVISASLGIDVPATRASNAVWLGPVVDPLGQLDMMVGVGHQSIPGGGDLAGYVNLITTGVRAFTVSSVTLANVADSLGGADATEATFSAAGFMYGYVTTTPTVDAPAFLEFDLKVGSSSPLASVAAHVSFDSGGAIILRRFPVPPASGWAHYRVPLKFPTATGSIHVLFSSAAAGKIQIGRVRLYHAAEPLNIDAALPAGGRAVSSVGGGLETVQAHGATSTTETFDLANGNVHTATLDANCTFTFAGATSGKACSMTLILTQDATGSRLVTWPASVDWPGGATPTLSTGAAKVDVLTFVTTDGGTTWLGFTSGLDLR